MLMCVLFLQEEEQRLAAEQKAAKEREAAKQAAKAQVNQPGTKILGLYKLLKSNISKSWQKC